MPTLEDQLTQSRDRITEILTKKKPEFRDVSKAFLRAVTQRKSYGEVMNEMKASRLGEQKTLFDVLSGHKKLRQADVGLGLKQQANILKRTELAMKQGNATAKALYEAAKDTTASEKGLSALLSYANDLPGSESVTPQTAHSFMAQAANEAREKGLITQKAEIKPSTAMKKVQDKDSPTGWSWESPSGEKMAGAPVPSGGITVDTKTGKVTIGQPTAAQAGKHTLDLEDQRVNVINFAKASHRLLSQLQEEGGETIGFTGALERTLDSIVSQGKAFARTWNDGGKLSRWVNQFEWSGELAGESAAVRSKIVSLAYGLALAKNGTRPTDQDIAYALEMLGKSGSPNQMAKAVNSLLTEAVDNYSTRHLEATGESWDVLGTFESHDIPVPERAGPDIELINQMNINELNELWQKGGLTPEEKAAIGARLEELGY